MVDFKARYRFRNVISCRFHDWNLHLNFVKFRFKVGPRSRNLLKKVRPLTKFSWITLKFNVFCWDKYFFSESLGCKLIENYDGFKNILLFFQRIVKQSKKVWYPTCLETNFILILNFPQISAKYAPKYQKRIIFYEFKQFWWIFNIFCVLCLCLLLYNYFQIFKKKLYNSKIYYNFEKLLKILLKQPWATCGPLNSSVWPF